MEITKLSPDAPQAWLDSIARGEADLQAGRLSDLEPFLHELETETAAKAAEHGAQTRGIIITT